ncbi:hypothetical protein G5B30_09570 [Sphingobacterium sp. SGG-5]|uniref:hypothetical protein n=1 Tax=Sphingobacterium sp. SGG-5 TaxID=2710881 RepID=UPI0013EE33F8|nr:hypothetical protein [Sphingobacterium sp. SGG-5]NGM62162.1 hypothetical protein [Sphingobacterium sp. SGG-5]
MKIRYIAMMLFAVYVFTANISCVKHEGYYDYVNTESIYNGTAIDYFKSKAGTYDSLLFVLDMLPEYKDLIAAGDVTIFAPTNASFHLAMTNLNLVRQSQGKPSLRLNELDLVHLDTLVSKYIVQGRQTTEQMLYVDGLEVNTVKNELTMHAQRIKQDASGYVGGGLVTVYYTDKKGSEFEILWVRSATQAVNIQTNDAVVHVLANGHEFGFGEFLTRMNK